MRVEVAGGEIIELGATETTPTIGITDYSRRVTDDFGVTTVVERDFARRMSVRLKVPFDDVDALQQRLAGLRATPALWVADDDLDSLSVTGFYKDFSIDLSVPPVSFCTLTVEGLAEPGAFVDPGGDPAADGASTLKLLQPLAVTDGVLTATSVPEADYAAWVGGTTYALGARVIKTATHRIYESVVAGNVGNDPAGASGKWLDVGPTNRWSMFDEALGSVTSGDSPLVVVLNASTANAIALLDVVGSTVRVQTTGYDRTLAIGDGPVLFLDLPATHGNVTVTITGSGQIEIGTLLIGHLVALGRTEASPTAGITDFSRKEVDDFGTATIVERAWAKRMALGALIRTDAVDLVAGRIAAVRARPSLWIGDDGLDTLTIYGFFKDFSIEVGENVSKVSLSIEGLSKAADLRLGGKLTRAEKITSLVPLIKRVRAELDMLDLQVPSLAGYPVVAAAAGAAAAAWVAWTSYRDALSPPWDDSSADTVIVRADYDAVIQELLMAGSVLSSALRVATEVLADTALNSAEAATTLASGKSAIFYQPTPPTAEESAENDRWLDTDNGNLEYRRIAGSGCLAFGGNRLVFGGNAIIFPPWAPAPDQRIGQALIDAAGAQATADRKVVTISQEATPTAEGVGDLWYQPSTKSLKRWNGAGWFEVATVGATAAELAQIADALTAAENAQATADGKIDSYYQATAPAGAGEGDLWTDTDDGNKLYRFTGGAWTAIRDSGIATAISNAAGAQATADGKVTSFVGPTAPTAEGVGDLWYDSDAGELFRWSGSTWAMVATVGATPAQIAAITAAATAADNAQATADGKIRSFYQATVPAAFGEGDYWTDTDDANKLYRASADSGAGGTWVLARDAGIGAAIGAAAGAQATADGKVTTFVGESAPTAEGIGDLWYKASTGTLSRWDGDSWDATSDATALNQVTATVPTLLEIAADFTGAIAGGTLPKLVIPIVKRGGADVTTANATTYSLSGFSGGCASANTTVDNTNGSSSKGQVSIGTGWTTSGGFVLYISFNGTLVGAYPVTVTKKLGAPPSGGGSGSSGYVKTGNFSAAGKALTSTSYVEIGRIANMEKATGESIYATFAGSYDVSGSGANNAYAKWQYSPAGANSWTDFSGGAATGSNATNIHNPPGGGLPMPDDPPEWDISSGSVTCNRNAAPADGNYDVRLMAALVSGSPGLGFGSGTAAVEIKP